MRFVRKLASVWTDRWLMWLIVASLVLPPTFYGLVAHQSRVATFAAADQQLVGTVRLLREHAEKVFDTDELVIEQVDRLTVGLSWDEIAHSEALHRQLKQLDDQLPQVNGIYVVAPDGTVANSSRLFPPSTSNLSDSAYFASLRDGYQGSSISDVHQGRTSGLLQFNLARRLSSPDGGFNGIILISDSPAYFEEAFQSIGDSAASVLLARDDGEELAYYPTPMFSGSRAPAELIARLPLKEPVLVTSIPLPYDASQRRAAFQRIGGYPLFIGLSVPTSSIAASWHETIVLNGVLVAVGSLTVAFMGWLTLKGYRSERVAHAAFRAEVQRREEAESRMQQAKKMEVIGQLSAGVAHDFNNLLTVISGNIERIPVSEAGDCKARIDAALSATARGDRLIRQMLTFAHSHVLERELVDINAVMTSLTSLLTSALGSNISLHHNLTPMPVVCYMECAEFDFAVLNIVTNARHAMPDGGELTIETATVSIDIACRELDLAPGQYARIAFTDRGQGMPPDVIARAFEPFFTTRERSTGTGLGLSQVYGFAKQSGGLATIKSEVGYGTTVTMYLPMVETDVLSEDASVVMAC
jgi:two-component system NtrC family sensor kinase